MNILGKKVTLRAIEKSDCELLKNMFNDPEIESLVVGWAFPLSSFAQEKWLDAHYNETSTIRLIIETPEDGAVGMASLVDIDWKNRCASYGHKIANMDLRGKGIGTDTEMAMMRYAFDELGLNRIEGSFLSENTASRRVDEKCGWSVEGERRKCIYKNGKWHNVTMVGILAEEYHALIEKNHYWD